jgi:hypothetical protein
MMTTTVIAIDPKRLDDGELLVHLRALVVRSNQTEAEMLEHLAEVDERRLYLPEHTSMFTFCTAELGFSEAAAENRIAAPPQRAALAGDPGWPALAGASHASSRCSGLERFTSAGFGCWSRT